MNVSKTSKRMGLCLLLVVGALTPGCPPESTVPDVLAFSINNDAATTTSRNVTLNSIASGSPTFYMASESPDFTGAEWEPYSEAASFQLSAGNGLKTVYFGVANDLGSSYAYMDTITLQEAATAVPAVTQFRINNGAATTFDRTVTLDSVTTGNPTQYMASESASFTGVTWQTYAGSVWFQLSEGDGSKTVYFKVKNTLGTSLTSSDTITLNETEETFLLPGNVPLTMIKVTGGTYLMGRTSGEQDSYATEAPQHSVTVPTFWMGKYELTKRQWLAIMGTTPWQNNGYVSSDLDSAAVFVSWDAAKLFISALNTYTGKTFKLPTEAQWEYACRAGTTTRFYWGNDTTYAVGDDYAWWFPNGWLGNHAYAGVVGQLLPNTLGLYDMIGNALEWCEDDWHVNYNGAPTNGSAWVDSSATSKVVRGGSWYSEPKFARSASREDKYSADYGSYLVGFRLAR